MVSFSLLHLSNLLLPLRLLMKSGDHPYTCHPRPGRAAVIHFAARAFLLSALKGTTRMDLLTSLLDPWIIHPTSPRVFSFKPAGKLHQMFGGNILGAPPFFAHLGGDHPWHVTCNTTKRKQESGILQLPSPASPRRETFRVESLLISRKQKPQSCSQANPP